MGAQWIWREGDYEFFLYRNVIHRRRERNVRANPGWEIPEVCRHTVFVRSFRLEKSTTLTLVAEGEITVRVDWNPFFEYDFDGRLSLPAGEHTLWVEVYNEEGLPSLFVEGEGAESGPEWTTYGGSGLYEPAGYAGLTDKTALPSRTGLPVRRTDAVRREKKTDAEGRKGWLYEFDREMLAYPVIEGSVGDIFLTYGESRGEALAGRESEQADVIACDGSAEACGKLSKAFRFVFVCPARGAAFHDLHALEEYYPVRCRARFSCSDGTLERIWKTALYTLELTSREFFLDGIKRDRWVWAGDAYQSELMSFYSYFDSETVRRTLLVLAGRGEVKCHVNGIMDYTFYVILATGEYYRYTGDGAFIAKIYPRLVRLIEFCLGRTDGDGMMRRVGEEWVFLDWADIDNGGEVCAEQFLLLAALRALRGMAEVAGKQPPADWEMREKDLAEKIDRKFWSEKGYFHDDGRKTMTRYGGIFAVLFGGAEEDKREVILRETLLGDVTEIVTPYMKFYEISALAKLGRRGEMLDFIRGYWGEMLKEGTGTFWEEYDPRVKGEEKYAMYGRKYGKSLCHSWGASAVYLLGRYLVGLRPALPGYARFDLDPYLDGKTYFRAVLPAGEGNIEVGYAEDALEVFSEKAAGTLVAGACRYEIEAGKKFVLPLRNGRPLGETESK